MTNAPGWIEFPISGDYLHLETIVGVQSLLNYKGVSGGNIFIHSIERNSSDPTLFRQKVSCAPDNLNFSNEVCEHHYFEAIKCILSQTEIALIRRQESLSGELTRANLERIETPLRTILAAIDDERNGKPASRPTVKAKTATAQPPPGTRPN